ncbi:hypothetical protein [Streptomyces sp. UH6]|uniref:hypothetical protein n=1 Tax=Streptomyces sp. UH6 TaxID=2748379 RepID=UPI0015D496BC|nr:hypothetical protein [Streptomyces sp. UH6]NYV72900.1 hypothetical protein [Streptomyces sp. UH6]
MAEDEQMQKAMDAIWDFLKKEQIVDSSAPLNETLKFSVLDHGNLDEPFLSAMAYELNGTEATTINLVGDEFTLDMTIRDAAKVMCE